MSRDITYEGEQYSFPDGTEDSEILSFLQPQITEVEGEEPQESMDDLKGRLAELEEQINSQPEPIPVEDGIYQLDDGSVVRIQSGRSTQVN